MVPKEETVTTSGSAEAVAESVPAAMAKVLSFPFARITLYHVLLAL